MDAHVCFKSHPHLPQRTGLLGGGVSPCRCRRGGLVWGDGVWARAGAVVLLSWAIAGNFKHSASPPAPQGRVGRGVMFELLVGTSSSCPVLLPNLMCALFMGHCLPAITSSAAQLQRPKPSLPFPSLPSPPSRRHLCRSTGFAEIGMA